MRRPSRRKLKKIKELIPEDAKIHVSFKRMRLRKNKKWNFEGFSLPSGIWI